MAVGDLYIECEGGGKQLIAASQELEIISALIVKTNTGKYGLRTVLTSATAGNITPVVGCGGPLLTLLEALQMVIVESASGAPALGLVTEA